IITEKAARGEEEPQLQLEDGSIIPIKTSA
ncbi:hypothetical protein, partial [Listeria monocytogenes]